MAKPDYDTTLARIAGNICAGLVGAWHAGDIYGMSTSDVRDIADRAVELAEAIVSRCKVATPKSEV